MITKLEVPDYASLVIEIEAIKGRLEKLEGSVSVTESIIEGATGTSGPLPGGTLQTLVDTAGSVLTLPPGVFSGVALVPRVMTIRGSGTTITAAGLKPKWDKGIFVPTVSGVVFEDMILTGASIDDSLGGNAAAIRGEPGAYFVMRRVEITGNQAGVLTSGGNVTIEDCYFHDNGAGNPGSGATHELYLNAGSHIIRNSRFVCGPLATHAIKSRGKIYIVDCELIGNGDDGTNGGAVLDVPNGGKLDVYRTTLEIEPGAANHYFLTYASDDATVGLGPVFLNVRLKGNGVPGLIESRVAGVPLTISGTYVGEPPELRGWGSVVNTLRRIL